MLGIFIWLCVFGLWLSPVYCQCGGELTGMKGDLHAPNSGGDSSYDPNSDCTWTIIAEPNNVIELQFYSMDIEYHAFCIYDYIEIYDDGALFGRYCGNEIPPDLTSTTNELVIVFHSDAKIQQYGFGAVYFQRQANGDHIPGDHIHKGITTCKFEEPQQKCRIGTLLDGDEYLFGQYCGTSVPPVFMYQKNVLLVYFHSDNSYTTKGFKASYSHVEWNGPSFCEYMTPVEIGTFNSSALDGDSDGLYDHNVDCAWVLFAPADKRVQVYITNMDIPSSDNCEFDYLEIYDYNISMGVFCGSAQPPLITSTSNTLYIYFYSDATINGIGFQAYFSKIDKDLQCGEMLTSGSGTIWSTDRDGDGRYDTSLDCIWTIIAPVGQIIKLQFHFVNMEGFGWSCYYDSIKIFDGHYNDATPIEEICGYGIGQTLWSSSRIFYVYFHTDSNGAFEGFNASYSVHEAETGPTSISTNASTETYTIMSTVTSTVSAKTVTETATSISPQTEGSTSSFGLSTESSSATASHITKATTVTDKSSVEISTLMSTWDKRSISSIGSSAGSSPITSGPISEESTTVTDKTSTETSTFFPTDNERLSLGSKIASSAITSDAMEHTSVRVSSIKSSTAKISDVTTETTTDKTSPEASTKVSNEDAGQISSVRIGTTATSGNATETTPVADKTSTEAFTLLSTEGEKHTTGKRSSTEVERTSVTTRSDITKVTTETTTPVKASGNVSTGDVISSADGIATESSRILPVTSGTNSQMKQRYSKNIFSTVTTDGGTHKKSTLSEILTDYRTFTIETTETPDRSDADPYRVTVYRMILIYILICLCYITLY